MCTFAESLLQSQRTFEPSTFHFHLVNFVILHHFMPAEPRGNWSSYGDGLLVASPTQDAMDVDFDQSLAVCAPKDKATKLWDLKIHGFFRSEIKEMKGQESEECG